MAKIIDFNEYKTKQAYKNSLNVSSKTQTHEDIDLSVEWANAEAENNFNRNNTFYKLSKSILISIKKCLTLNRVEKRTLV